MEPYHNHYKSTFFCGWHLTVHFWALGSNKDGMLTNTYGLQSAQDKDLFLHRLSFVSMLIGPARWIIGGDFNIILTLEEKSRGTKQLEHDSGKFQMLMDQLKLIDIETRNEVFT